jgi:transcription initiation factor TFIIB
MVDVSIIERYKFEEFDQRARKGASILLSHHDKGLATIIGEPTKDASGRSLDVNTRAIFRRLKAWDIRTQFYSSTDKNLKRAVSELCMLRDKLGLSDVLIEKTAQIYRKAERRGLVRGRTIPSVLAATVYLACRETGTPRTLKDLIRASNVKYNDLARNVRLLTIELGVIAPIHDPMKCIVRVANMTKTSERTRRLVFKMINELVGKKYMFQVIQWAWLRQSST